MERRNEEATRTIQQWRINMKQEYSDYRIWTTESMKEKTNGIILSCKKCTWDIDLLKLDSLLDIEDELNHHRDKCFEWSNHEASSTN